MAGQAQTIAVSEEPRVVVNMLFYRIMKGLLRRFILRYFMLEPVNADAVPSTGPGLILANHNNLFDVIWLYAMLRRPVFYAANEDLFRTWGLRRVIRWFGAFPKRKAAADVGAIRSIDTIVRGGGLVGVFPEGVRSWDGSNHALGPAIAKLIRRRAVPVYVCRFEGSYLAYPRWARRWRKIRVRALFTKLYDSDTIPPDNGRILTDISEAIRTPDFDPSFPGVARRRGGLAVNITRLLYRCPSCGTVEGLKLVRPYSTNRVECSSCFSAWEVNASCRLALTDENGQQEGEWITLPECYRRIRDMPMSRIRTEIRLGLEPGEQLYLISRPRFLFSQISLPAIRTHSVAGLRVIAFGRAFLTDRRLIFRNRLGVRLSAPLASIGALSIEPGDKLHFTVEGKLYRIPFRNESALKWYDLLHRFRDQAGAVPAGAAPAEVRMGA